MVYKKYYSKVFINIFHPLIYTENQKSYKNIPHFQIAKADSNR